MENVAKVRINGKSCMALLDNGAQVNTIMPRYVQEHSLPVGPITNLMDSKVACVGLGNSYTRPLGYAIVRVQVDGVRGYDEDQIALIIPDPSHFAKRVPVILGTPTIGSCKCDERGRDGCPCHTMGKCQGGTSPGHV